MFINIRGVSKHMLSIAQFEMVHLNVFIEMNAACHSTSKHTLKKF